MTLFEKMGYDEETIKTLAVARCRTGLTNISLVILHENVKVGNTDYLTKVNEYIVNECKSTQDVNEYIQANNPLDIPEIK